MICVHCEYKDNEWVQSEGSDGEFVRGSEGKFYRGIDLSRENDYMDELASIVGCPSCKKVFIQGEI